MSPHVYDAHVRFSDVDVYGHVNNVKYFEYYQEARLGFLSSLGGGEGDFALVVARVAVDYRRPILFRTEPYAVDTWVVRVGRSSFTLGSEIRDGSEVLSRAETVLVTFDIETRRARPLREIESERLLADLNG
ncbi:MAG: acyl-CoA thioesterase [Actinomycetota bacterium]|nr:acyl-CoA thioesterase [Actinomycetota bacterium]